MQNSDGVYIVLDRPRKLTFRHKDISQACLVYQQTLGASGRSGVVELIQDEMIGWPILLQFGLRFYNADLKSHTISDLIDEYVKRRKKEGVRLPNQEIGDKLRDALVDEGWLAVERADPGQEGNAPAPTGA